MARDFLMNHVGFLPWSAEHFVIANPPEKSFTVIRGLGAMTSSVAANSGTSTRTSGMRGSATSAR